MYILYLIIMIKYKEKIYGFLIVILKILCKLYVNVYFLVKIAYIGVCCY